MGFKVGMFAEADNEKMFVLDASTGSLAQPIMVPGGEFWLRYPCGRMRKLTMNFFGQIVSALEVKGGFEVIQDLQWVPTREQMLAWQKKLPRSRVMFGEELLEELLT